MADELLLEKENNSDKNNVSILIIDDDENITRTFARILQKNGYQTDIAQTAAEAIQKTASQSYDVALVDVCLPDMNGMDLLFKIGNNGGKMIKIIITGFASMSNNGAHPDAYLLKPIKPQELLSIISQKTKVR